jgi:hypothetical protein
VTTHEKRSVENACVANIETSSDPLTRRSLLGATSLWSFRRKLTLASAALFASIAARGPASASAGNVACCNLARPDKRCGNHTGWPPFWCNYGGFRRLWYCCDGGNFWGCGECQSGSGTCFDGPTFYCSYAWYSGSC